ncbi:histidinol-phosphate transaminase [Clostridium sp. DJ247]|uniref:pyridoxal phosphate-dependent aminotransferase n=1 Tax=Clostridium sp. DJ247 TaxID=2726188 RepID=UPI001F4CCCAD|nr:histidinol-phosphate transaminase [Clostridium sp. DJ247]MBC2580772.1 aminotransferase class I/II-fold pyridoxal phosphate-dependent enzyme [Clostridium sp. DJ247]
MEHGGDIYTEGLLKGKKLLDFSSNINPLGVPQSFKDNINEAVESLERYPDVKYRELRKNIKEYLKFSKSYFREQKEDVISSENQVEYIIDEEGIALGNGAAEILDLVISCFKSICIVVPSFIEYELNALKWGCNIQYSYLKENMDYDYDNIKEKMKLVDALIIGNPNNPNGQVIDKEKFKAIVEYCEENNKIIIIDEAFIEFTGKRGFSFLEKIEKYKCIFIVRALTKFYAMPGVRLGYGISSNKKLIESIKSKQNPWNINCFAETAAKYALKDKEYIENSLEWIEEERNFMTDSLGETEIIKEVYQTYSNFILCKLKNVKCYQFYDKCLKHGIAVRKCNNFRGLDEDYIRLAIKDRESNEKIIEVLNQNIFLEE